MEDIELAPSRRWSVGWSRLARWGGCRAFALGIRYEYLPIGTEYGDPRQKFERQLTVNLGWRSLMVSLLTRKGEE